MLAARLPHVTYWRQAFHIGMKHWIEHYRGFSVLHASTAMALDDAQLNERLKDLLWTEHAAQGEEPRYITGVKVRM